MLNDAVVKHHEMVFGFGFQRMIYLMSIYGENGIKQSVWYGMVWYAWHLIFLLLVFVRNGFGEDKIRNVNALRSDAIWEIELLARIQPKMMIQYESECEKRDKIYYGKFGSNRFDRLDAPIDIYLLRTICYLDSVNSVRGPM